MHVAFSLLALLALAPAPAGGVVAQASAAPSPSPSPLTVRGFFRSYYFTRQNASNNPGVQDVFAGSPPKYNSNAVNQASLNNAIDLHADYRFAGGWYVGGTYFYANPADGPCSVAKNHAKGSKFPKPSCTTQIPPNTNPDDTLPGFALSTFDEAYLGYSAHRISAKIGDQIFISPWAGPVDTRVKPAAFQGGDFTYTTPQGWTFEAADMLQFEPRTSSNFISSTLLTSYPAGNNGLAPNIVIPGGGAITTDGFVYTHVGFTDKDGRYFVNGALYNVANILNMWWFDGRYNFGESRWHPFVWLQGGVENNAGTSVIGKIDSSLFGVEAGANATRDIVVSGAFVETPWQTDTVYLPKGVSCNNSTYQISAKSTLAYFLPLNAGQCYTNANGTTNVYYGGWASPYTDNYATNPVFTTAISQGMTDRRAPGTSWRVAGTYTSPNGRAVFIAGDAWYNYGNALVAQNTNEWNLDGTYRFFPVHAGTPYRGLQIRYRYAQRSYTNTYCGAAGSTCPVGFTSGQTFLGGQPLFKYNRAMLEYDF